MKIERILYTTRFGRAYKKLPKNIKKQAKIKEKIFRENCFDPCLKTHKLKGQLVPYWSFSIDYSYRILFDFQNDASAVFIDVGPHAIYH